MPPSAEPEAQPTLPQSELRLVLLLNQVGEATAPQLARAMPQEFSADTVKALLNRLAARGIVTSRKPSTSRLWSLDRSVVVPDLLRTDIRHILENRYGFDPLAIQALLQLVGELVNQKSSQNRSA